MIARIKLLAPEPVYDALSKSAETNLRSVDNEALYIVRQELARRGLLPTEQPTEQPQETQHELQAA